MNSALGVWAGVGSSHGREKVDSTSRDLKSEKGRIYKIDSLDLRLHGRG